MLQTTDASAEGEREVRVLDGHAATDTAARRRLVHASDEVHHGADSTGGECGQAAADQLGVGCGQTRLAAAPTHL